MNKDSTKDLLSHTDSVFTDETIMPFGTHKGKTLANIPDSYFIWFYNTYNRGELYGNYKKLYDYIVENKDSLKIKD